MISQSLIDNTLLFHYQKIVNPNNKYCVAYEALARLRSPTGSIIPPSVFLPKISNSQLSFLDQKVIQHNFQISKALKHSFDTTKININIGSLFSLSKRKLKYLLYVFEKDIINNRVSPKNIVFEITESTIFSCSESILQFLNEVRLLGFSIAIDDLGALNSNLYRLCVLPVEFVKSDISIASLLSDPDHHAKAQSLLKFLSHFCSDNGSTLIIEGIENKEQHQRVCELDNVYAQGYFYSMPSAKVFPTQPLNLQAEDYYYAAIRA
ncbi:MAG: EAL domain-containing protein [Endozoicomonadaceae bacterium]|nr:EAL domain-containing protein [Endozoicomonadaceae bacterium]